jgi:hypothetical protein
MTRTLGIHIPSPVATKRSIENELVVLEPRFYVTRALEVGLRKSEGSSVGCFGRDADGNTAAGEKPRLDGCAGPFHSVDTAAVGVETGAKGVGYYGVDVAARGARGAVEGTVIEILGAELADSIRLMDKSVL